MTLNSRNLENCFQVEKGKEEKYGSIVAFHEISFQHIVDGFFVWLRKRFDDQFNEW